MEATNQTQAQARGRSALNIPEETAMSGSACLPQVMEVSDDLVTVNEQTEPSPPPTLESQLQMHYHYMRREMGYDHPRAIQTLLQNAQNEQEAELIRANAVV